MFESSACGHDSLHDTDAHAKVTSNRFDAFTLLPGYPDGLLFGRGNSWPTEGLAGSLGALPAGTPPLLNHPALEFREYASHLKHRLACRGGGVDALLMQIQVDILSVNLAEERDQVSQ